MYIYIYIYIVIIIIIYIYIYSMLLQWIELQFLKVWVLGFRVSGWVLHVQFPLQRAVHSGGGGSSMPGTRLKAGGFGTSFTAFGRQGQKCLLAFNSTGSW